MSKFFVANLATVVVLMAASSVLADPVPASTPEAQAPAPASQPAAVAAAQDPKKKSSSDIICKREEETGSRLGGKKICMTRGEWDQQARDTQDQYFNGAPRH